VNGWNVNWQFNSNRLAGSWNANISGSNPYTATNMSWNGNLAVGQSVSFGFQVEKNGGSAERPVVNGAVCGGAAVSSVPRSSSSIVPSSAPRSSSSVVPSSAPRSSSSVASTPRSSSSVASSSGYE